MPEQRRGILDRFLHGPDPAHPDATKAVTGAVAPAVPFTNSGWYGNFTTGGQMTGGTLPTLFAGSRIDFNRAVGDMEMSSAIMACVQYVQRVFPEAPLRVVTRDPKGDVEIENHPLTMLLDEPNPYMSGAAVFQALLADYNIHGNAYLLKFRTAGGRVAELWWEPHLTIRPTWDPAGQHFVTGYQIWRVGKWYPMDVDDVIHFRWSQDPRNTRMGLSPLRSALRLIFNDEEAEAYCAALLHNMGSPGAIISPAGDKTLQPDEALRLMNYFNTRFTGDGRGTTMVATGGLQVAMPSYNPKDLDLTNIHQFSESRVSGLMGVAAIVAGLSVGLQHATYSNYATAREATYDANIVPTYVSFANTLTRALLRDDFGGQAKQFVAFDMSNVRALQPDETAIATRAKDLFGAGIIDRAKALLMIGDEPKPIDEGVYFLPRGGSFSGGEIAEPVSAIVTKVDTEPPATQTPIPPGVTANVASNGTSKTPMPAANA